MILATASSIGRSYTWSPHKASSGSISSRTNPSIQSSFSWNSGSVSKSHAMRSPSQVAQPAPPRIRFTIIRMQVPDEGGRMAEDNDAPAAAERRRRGIATYRDVMKSDPPARSSPFTEIGMLDFVFAEVWARPGLSRRDRRFVSLACVAAADAAAPIEEHVYAALASGDITFEEMQEVVLHFAVYCGWPKGSFFEQVTWSAWARVHAARGEVMPPPQPLPYPPTPGDPELRLQGGEREFRDVNHVPAPPRTSPYTQAGILNFVFGEMWQRPNLGRREIGRASCR